jgi:hypothetical protein
MLIWTITNIQYHPTRGTATVFLEQLSIGAHDWVNTTEAALQALAPDGALWGDAEALAIAQAHLDTKFPGQGFIAALPAAA